MHVILGLNAITSDWPTIAYREGLRRLLFVFGWGTFYSACGAAVGALLGAFVPAENAWALGMILGAAVSSFQFVLVARALRAPSRVHVLAWLFVVGSWLFILMIGAVFLLARVDS